MAIYTEFDWPDEACDMLRELWAAGHPTKLIGEMIGARFGGGPMTKNQIIGKSRRLDLPRRDSPIKGVVTGAKALTQHRKRHVPKLPKPASLAAPLPNPLVTVKREPKPEPVVIRLAPLAPRVDGRGCQWVHGDVPGKWWRCDADLSPRCRYRVWCPEHYAVVYPGRAAMVAA